MLNMKKKLQVSRMSNVKKVFVVVSLIVFVSATSIITNKVTQIGADRAYAKLEAGYLNIKESNQELTRKNIKLESNNKRITIELDRSNRFVVKARDITKELERGLGEAGNTIERIELTVGAIEDIIKELPE